MAGDAILFERAARRLGVRFPGSTRKYSHDYAERVGMTITLLNELARELREEAGHLAGPYRTKSGRLLTDAELDEYVTEAEEGYDVSGPDEHMGIPHVHYQFRRDGQAGQT